MSLLREGFLQGDGVYLVEASAGTGKTHTMVETAVDLMLEGQIVRKPERLLAVTFTRAATAELKERLRAALYAAREKDEHRDNPNLAAALASMDRLAVTTIHGFCTGVLEEFALECGVPMGLRFVEDISEYVDTAVADEWRTLTWPESRESELVLGALLNGKTDEWSPAALRKAALTVRGAIGAQHAPRLASREAVVQGVLDAATRVAQQFDEAALRGFVQAVVWNKGGLEAAQVDDLARAVRDIRAGRIPSLRDLRPWALPNVQQVANKTKKKTNDPLIAEQPILASIAALVEMLDAASSDLWADAVLGIVERLEQAMARDRVAGFDDMIRMVERALTGPDGAALQRVLHERYDVVLVDEFQDTDWAQWRIFSTAFAKRPLVLVGDPKQSIYGFRGADIFAYLEAKRAAVTAGRVKPLAVNRRSDPGVVRATGLLFDVERPFDVPREQLDFQPVTAHRTTPTLVGDDAAKPLMFVEAGKSTAGEQETRISGYIAAEVARLLAHDKLQYTEKEGAAPRRLRANDIAVLVRNNAQGAAFVEALRARGVPAVTTATGDVSESETWRDVLALIIAVDDPADDRAVRRALVTPLGGCDAAQLAALVADTPRWRAHIERLVQARRDWSRRGVLTALTRLMADPLWDSVARLARRADAERRLTDLRHILGLLQRAERDGHRTPSSLVTWARRFADRSAEEKETRALHLESDGEAVQITTIHSAKGLEWPVVFCPYLWKKEKENKDPVRLVRREGGERWIRLTTPFEDELPRDTELSEGLRLAYVALTRARARLYVVNGADGSTAKTQSPLGHLLAAQGDDPGAALAARSADIGLVRIDDRPIADTMAAVGTTPHGPCIPALRPLRDAQTRSWTVSSYTALTASAAGAGAHVGVSATSDEPGPVDGAEAGTPSDDPSLRADQLPSGAHVGNALHALFEKFDFPRVAEAAYCDAAIAEVMESYALPRAGADAAARQAAAGLVQRMLTQTLQTAIPGAGSALAAVPMSDTLREWRFHLPVEATSASRLAAAFRRAGDGWLAEEYAPRLARLSSRELRGFLTGVVDLVARVDGQWWIVDWKSNTLGPTGTSYAALRCREEMIDTHYVLQYHLYAVALHRFLQQRVRGYAYARDFGGVGYAFLRGLAMGVPAWFHDRPTPALIDALDAALGRRPA